MRNALKSVYCHIRGKGDAPGMSIAKYMIR
jgi:hypothetical protein